jgi:hypothetical protein
MSERYFIGQTDFECWGRLWKAGPSDPEVDAKEWVTFVARIQEQFRTQYQNFPDDFYFWGDFSGDRTLDLKIAKPTDTGTPLTHSPEEPDHDTLDRELGSRKKIRIGWILGSKKRLPVIEQIALQR